jgi:creatinine amidohydrolase
MTPRVKAVHFSDGDDWHANDAETSLMLAVAPEIVREDQIATADDPDRTEGLVFSHPVNRTSKNGVTGYPSRATKKKGEDLFAMMVEDLSDMIRRGMTETPPLDASYNTPFSST